MISRRLVQVDPPPTSGMLPLFIEYDSGTLVCPADSPISAWGAVVPVPLPGKSGVSHLAVVEGETYRFRPSTLAEELRRRLRDAVVRAVLAVADRLRARRLALEADRVELRQAEEEWR